MSIVEGKFNGRPHLKLNEDATLKEVIISFNNLINRLEEIMKTITDELNDSRKLNSYHFENKDEIWNAIHNILIQTENGLIECKCFNCNLRRHLSVER
jgi:hypothetical protein